MDLFYFIQNTFSPVSFGLNFFVNTETTLRPKSREGRQLFLLRHRNCYISTKTENVELKNGELTRAGFLELNQMEAEDNQGDTDDLWVTLSNMGYNKGLNVDEVGVVYHPHF